MMIFTYELATYLSTGDVTGLKNALFRGSCGVSRVSIGCAVEFQGRIGLGARVGLYVAG